MTQSEPGGWELKRSIDQLRADNRDDFEEIKADLNGLGMKLDGLDKRYVTHSVHDALKARVTSLEAATSKRGDRTVTIWLAIGIAALSAVLGVGNTILSVVLR